MKKWLIIATFLCAPLVGAQATNVYVTPSGTATGNCPSGTASAPNLTPTQFNTAGNWGTGTGKIGSGTTVHLCGAFTDNTPGDTLLNFQGSGVSGSPITLLFGTGATLTNTAYWGSANNGAINIYNQSWIVINGANTGVIQNTGNGTGLAYAMPSIGVEVYGGSNITVENLTVANICQHTSTSDNNACNSGGNNDGGIIFMGVTNSRIQNNIVHDTQNCIFAQAVSGANVLLVTGNTTYNCNWGVGVDYPISSGTVSGITISNNTIHDAVNWDSTTDAFHHNGIMLFDTNGTGGFSGVVEEGNYIYGDFGVDNTAWIFNDDNTQQMTGFYIYNNVLVNGSATNTVNNCYVTGTGNSSFVFNNTIWGNGLGTGICSGSSMTIENNLISSVKAFISATSPTTLINYNQYQNKISYGCDPWLYGGGPCSGQSTFAAWQTASGGDSLGTYQTANSVNANGTLQAGSPAIGAGVNLTSLGITTLNVDAAGKARPSTGAWDIGAYQYQSGSTGVPTSLGWMF